MREFAPESLFLVICSNRTLFLQENANIEVEDYTRFFEQLIIANGQAEIYMYKGHGGVLNSAFVAVGMREGAAKAPLPSVSDCHCPYSEGGQVIPLATRPSIISFVVPFCSKRSKYILINEIKIFYL